MKRHSEGMTLVEVLVTLFVLVLTLTTAGQVLMAAQAAARSALARGDLNQQVRLALNLIGEDLTYAVAGPDLGTGVAPVCCSVTGGELAVWVYQIRTGSDGWQPQWHDQGWPGMPKDLFPLQVRYRVEEDRLVRDVTDPARPGSVYERQVIMPGITAADFQADPDGRVLVRLQAKATDAGVDGRVEAESAWFVRTAASH